ncbi:MAG: DUF3791 domain-containing protein [Paludibacter sp.]|nr:DUF3791 domain-containing protein [Paludibacter sp.]
MIKLSNIQQFEVFCLENYKISKGINGKAALNDFKNYHVFDFLTAGYDVLHTQGKNYIVAEINDFIERRK